MGKHTVVGFIRRSVRGSGPASADVLSLESQPTPSMHALKEALAPFRQRYRWPLDVGRSAPRLAPRLHRRSGSRRIPLYGHVLRGELQDSQKMDPRWTASDIPVAEKRAAVKAWFNRIERMFFPGLS